MKLPRDVANDLLPLYLAGEASAETRTLLEEYLRENPDFAREVREGAGKTAALLDHAVAPPAPDLEKATLERTRRFSRWRAQMLGFGISFTLMPFAFAFDDQHVRWFMLRDHPMAATYFWVAALGCWIAYVVMSRRLHRGL